MNIVHFDERNSIEYWNEYSIVCSANIKPTKAVVTSPAGGVDDILDFSDPMPGAGPTSPASTSLEWDDFQGSSSSAQTLSIPAVAVNPHNSQMASIMASFSATSLSLSSSQASINSQQPSGFGNGRMMMPQHQQQPLGNSSLSMPQQMSN